MVFFYNLGHECRDPAAFESRGMPYRPNEPVKSRHLVYTDDLHLRFKVWIDDLRLWTSKNSNAPTNCVNPQVLTNYGASKWMVNDKVLYVLKYACARPHTRICIVKRASKLKELSKGARDVFMYPNKAIVKMHAEESCRHSRILGEGVKHSLPNNRLHS